MSLDTNTAAAFASSWNNLPPGSVYTRDQFEDWLTPLTKDNVVGRSVLELGCGNASLLVHMAAWGPSELVGVDLGDSVLSATENLRGTQHPNARIEKGDLTEFRSDGFDVVYCIGVLHHLKDPKLGFCSVVENTKANGAFHCWVYGKEGNALVRLVVEPLRHVTSRLPWWFTKYLVATPLVAPYYLYAKLLRIVHDSATPHLRRFLRSLPLYEYSLWIANREFQFFRHVAFDQLVTPQTRYIGRSEVLDWLNSVPRIDQKSTYVISRNGNSWKFGGRVNSKPGASDPEGAKAN